MKRTSACIHSCRELDQRESTFPGSVFLPVRPPLASPPPLARGTTANISLSLRQHFFFHLRAVGHLPHASPLQFLRVCIYIFCWRGIGSYFRPTSPLYCSCQAREKQHSLRRGQGRANEASRRCSRAALAVLFVGVRAVV